MKSPEPVDRKTTLGRICPDCTRINGSEEKSCLGCGTDLHGQASSNRGEVRRTVLRETQICRECGVSYGARALYCIDCGCRLGSGAQDGAQRAAGQDRVTTLEEKRLIGWLVSFDHQVSGQSFELLSGSNEIGRERRCAVSLYKDSAVSMRHAHIHWTAGRCEIIDDDSRLGTRLNGAGLRPGEPTLLSAGDLIEVGATRLLVQLLDLKQVDSVWSVS